MTDFEPTDADFEPTPLQRDIELAIDKLKGAEDPTVIRDELDELSRWGKRSQFFPFESVEEANALLDDVSLAKSKREKLNALSDGVRLFALKDYRKAYLSNLTDVGKMVTSSTIDNLAKSARFHTLERYLSDLAQHGYKRAEANLKKPVRGYMFAFSAGFFSLIEIGVLLLILNACQRGFEVLIVSLLALIYVHFGHHMLRESNKGDLFFVSLLVQIERVRILLQDRLLDWDQEDKDLDELDRSRYRNRITTYVADAKYLIIEVIAIVEILRTVL
jgi:hypothetical protein